MANEDNGNNGTTGDDNGGNAANVTGGNGTPPPDDQAWEEGGGKGSKAAVLAELAETRRKAKAAEKELAEARKASMSEQEKAVAEAEQRGQSKAVAAFAGRLASAEIRAAASGRVPRDVLDGFLEFADLARFVGEDGEPDRKAIDAAIKKLAGNGNGRTDYDGGARTPGAKPQDMNQMIRSLAGYR